MVSQCIPQAKRAKGDTHVRVTGLLKTTMNQHNENRQVHHRLPHQKKIESFKEAKKLRLT
jgi:hypothetical protein